MPIFGIQKEMVTTLYRAVMAHSVAVAHALLTLISSVGNSVGRLRAYGPQVLHGNGPDPPGGLGPLGHRQRLVQVVPYLLSGRSQHRTTHQAPLPVLPGERHQPLVHLDTQ